MFQLYFTELGAVGRSAMVTHGTLPAFSASAIAATASLSGRPTETISPPIMLLAADRRQRIVSPPLHGTAPLRPWRSSMPGRSKKNWSRLLRSGPEWPGGGFTVAVLFQ